MKIETRIKNIIEIATNKQFHPTMPSVWTRVPEDAKGFIMIVNEHYIVQYVSSRLTGRFFEVYSFYPGEEGVYQANRTPSGVIGKVNKNIFRSENLTKNYTVETLYTKLLSY